MKKLLLVLVVLSLIGCSSPVDEPDVDNPFIGTWEQIEYGVTLQFTNSNFMFKQNTTGNEFSGIYTYTETTITFDPDEKVKDITPWT